MTNDAAEIWFRGMRENGQRLPGEYVIHKPFEAIDAALHVFLSVQAHQDVQAPPFKRRRLTMGSVNYSLFLLSAESQPVEFATIHARLAADQQTYLKVTLQPVPRTMPLEHKEGYEGFAKVELYVFYEWLMEEDKRISALAAIQPVFPPLGEDGRPTLSLREMPEVVQTVLRTESIPEKPDPSIDGWTALFAWEKQFGRLQGIKSDKDLALKLGLSHDHVRAMRREHGEPRRNRNRD